MKVETKVGVLFLGGVALIVGFAFLLGAFNPFSNTNDLHVTYNYAGGIEVGSPVRVMGIKVGKVKSVNFDPNMRDLNGQEVKLDIVISVDKKAWETIRGNSEFYINLAGIIGEKFLEITPGTSDAPPLAPGSIVRGVDPPRIDQMISQSYALAGKIIDLVQKNEGSVTNTLTLLNTVVVNFNKTLALVDKTTKNEEINRLLKNMVQISDDVAHVSKKLKSADTEKTINLMHKLIWRLEDLDKDSIKKFFQDEGVRARIF